jgi:hypothetical protein
MPAIGEGPFSGWSKSKQRLDERLGDKVAPWTLHDLRRTFATIASDHDYDNIVRLLLLTGQRREEIICKPKV